MNLKIPAIEQFDKAGGELSPLGGFFLHFVLGFGLFFENVSQYTT